MLHFSEISLPINHIFPSSLLQGRLQIHTLSEKNSNTFQAFDHHFIKHGRQCRHSLEHLIIIYLPFHNMTGCGCTFLPTFFLKICPFLTFLHVAWQVVGVDQPTHEVGGGLGVRDGDRYCQSGGQVLAAELVVEIYNLAPTHCSGIR